MTSPMDDFEVRKADEQIACARRNLGVGMSKGKVLIVEDEPIVAMDLKQEVQELGYIVTGVAESADEALAIVQSEIPDFALMDIRIVGSLDGIQTARALRHWYSIPSIFLTSYSDDTILARASRTMPYGYLTKPFKSAELKATLRMALVRSRTEAENRAEEQQVTETINGMNEGILTLNSQGEIRFMNHAAEMLTGWNASVAIGKLVRQILRWSAAQNQAVPDFENWPADKQGEWPACTLMLAGEDKAFLDLTLTPMMDGDGQHRGFVLVLRDASERLRLLADEELCSERPCFDRSPMAMLQLDSSGRIERINEALLRECGIAAEKVLGKTLTGLNLDPDPRIAHDLMPRLLAHTSHVAGLSPQNTH